MKIAITGGTGFLGSHLALWLSSKGHHVVLLARGLSKHSIPLDEISSISFRQTDMANAVELTKALAGCGAVINCVGIDREVGEQTFETVHIGFTRNLLSALRQAGVERLLHVSFLRARAKTDSPYHVTKWQAEEMIRASSIKYTIFKPGVVYGKDDTFLTNLKAVLNNFPFFGLVGFKSQSVAPLYVKDLCRAVEGCLEEETTVGKTYSVVGPEILSMAEIVDLTADTIDIIAHKIPLPIFLHRVASLLMEKVMEKPLLTDSQVTILAESLVEPMPKCDELPEHLLPRTEFLKFPPD